MLRKLLSIAVALALPVLLAGQARGTPNAPVPHGSATHFRGEVAAPQGVRAAEEEVRNNQKGAKIEEQKGENHQEGVNEALDGQNEHEGLHANEPEGLENQEGEIENGPNSEATEGGRNGKGSSQEDPAAPVSPAQKNRAGMHKP